MFNRSALGNQLAALAIQSTNVRTRKAGQASLASARKRAEVRVQRRLLKATFNIRALKGLVEMLETAMNPENVLDPAIGPDDLQRQILQSIAGKAFRAAEAVLAEKHALGLCSGGTLAKVPSANMLEGFETAFQQYVDSLQQKADSNV